LPEKEPSLPARLSALAERWELPDGAVGRLEQLLVCLAEHPEAPTSVRDPIRGVDVHVADSLSVFELEGFRSLRRLVDIGSGAGFPGLVLALAMPEAHFDLVEASGRKCAFVERTSARAGIENVRVVHARAEEWAAREGAQAYAGVVVRAVGSLATLLEYAAPLLQPGGKLVAWKGRRDPDEERQGSAAAEILGMRQLSVDWVGAYAGSRNRHIYSYEKAAPSPPRFPRRSGMARKRPLGR
jgi:16S rRNA (guanine527-N7)-methyltransferase